MLISTKYQFVFLCAEKCASNAIEDMLRPYSDIAYLGVPEVRHTNYRDYEKFIRPYLESKLRIDDFETLCLVREPISWLHSWYRFRARHDLRDPRHPSHKNCTYGISFDEFIEAYVSEKPPAFANVNSQFDFVKNAASEVGVKTVFAYDHIDVFVQHMRKKIGVNLTLGVTNTSPKTATSSGVTEHIASITRRILAKTGISRVTAAKPSSFRSSETTKYLPKSLQATLKSFIPRDFELHHSAVDSRHGIN